MSSVIQVPHNFVPRDYQLDAYNFLDKYNRGILVWNRRAGKDKLCFSIAAKECFKRIGTYFYMLPFYKQARNIIWEGMDGSGFKFLHHIHPELWERKNNQDMTLELKNGSVLKMVGSDNMDSIVGANPVGVIFSEFSLHKPGAWDFVRPILLENNGWALFNGTPRGKNHLYTLLIEAEKDPNWYTSVLGADETKTVTPEQVEAEIRLGMPKAIAMQEFYCSFEAALTGAFYAEGMARMTRENRITVVPWEPDLEVHVSWDLGIDDMMSLVFFQQLNQEVRIIDFYENNGQGLEHYVKVQREKDYVYGDQFLPHDIKVRELGTGKSRFQTLQKLGLKRLRVMPKASIEDGINAVRTLMSRVWIDKTKCARLIEALKGYRAEWDPVTQVYGKPIHDWTSHIADAVRMLAIGIRNPNTKPLVPYAQGTDHDPYAMPANQQPPRNFTEMMLTPIQYHNVGNWHPEDHNEYDMDRFFQ